jgi:hypothetical protein
MNKPSLRRTKDILTKRHDRSRHRWNSKKPNTNLDADSHKFCARLLRVRSAGNFRERGVGQNCPT